MSDYENSENNVSVTNWVITLILLCIPLVNFVLILVWAFGGTAYPAKKTFAQANIVLWLLAALLVVALLILLPLLGMDVQTYFQHLQEQGSGAQPN